MFNNYVDSRLDHFLVTQLEESLQWNVTRFHSKVISDHASSLLMLDRLKKKKPCSSLKTSWLKMDGLSKKISGRCRVFYFSSLVVKLNP